MDPNFDQLSATTLSSMQRDAVSDNFMVDGALQRLINYYGSRQTFEGGLFMQEPFIYDRVNGGAATPGADRQVIQKNIIAALGFPPKEYIEEVPLNEWQTEVINAGPAAMVSIYDTYMKSAVDAASTDFNIDAYQHGQPASTTVAQNRTIFINGIDEVCCNGVDPGYLGNVYTNYGGQLRTGVVNNTLNGQVIWAGDQAGNPGQTNYGTLLGGYLQCVQPPDTGVGNKAVFQYIAQRCQTQQRFVEEGTVTKERDSRIGLTGFRLLEAVIHVDKLAPSTKYGALLPSGLSQTTSLTLSAFTTPASPSTASGYPSATSCKPGEPFFWLRLKDWKYRPTGSAKYTHFFTPPIYSQTNPDLLVIFYRNGWNWYTPSPRDNAQIVGFGF